MGIKQVLMQVDFSINDKELKELKKETNELITDIRKALSKDRVKAEVFLGGSFAKGTLVKSSRYDADIFVRFDAKYDDISEILDKAINKIKGYRIERIHGSRDYFKMKGDEAIEYEIVPVIKIRKANEARNITDLSYFHVNYVKKKLSKKMAREVILAKAFCKANGVYGAESYINGFSGYALECLIIYYKSLERMLRELARAKEKVIIDPAGFYKNKNEILLNINESRLKSPVVLVDPTWKERNVLAALSSDSFNKFRTAALKFLKNPKIDAFRAKEFDENAFREKAKKDEFIKVKISTDRQEGDIAGTKLKNFSKFLIREIEKLYDVSDSYFRYEEGKEADLFLIAGKKKDILKKGPPVKMKEACLSFKRANKNVFEKSGILYAKVAVKLKAKDYLNNWIKKYNKTIKQMDVSKIDVN